ncbi:MAG: six-cysteine ranthipeptide SCIFF [Clostridia bacterium]|jgi:predicted ribosomally synthesized six-cysteine peptide SCIFF|nr:six-cysteine ranthipeptide SCIFF [Bacilli bacterium]MDD4121031.1 six-cysteine ranthipeptide SCIFF [Clostridia bacterium]
MKHISTLNKNLFEKKHNIGCNECQASCQSACKTSCTVGNQSCAQDEKIFQKKDLSNK